MLQPQGTAIERPESIPMNKNFKKKIAVTNQAVTITAQANNFRGHGIATVLNWKHSARPQVESIYVHPL